MSWQIIVHAGAGAAPRDAETRQMLCEGIVEQGAAILRQGGSAIDACERAVCLLEDAEALNAGRGSYIQLDGQVRMDACLMTSDLEVGAVIQIPHVRNPISVARRLLESRCHVALAGEGALAFAREMGFEMRDPITPRKQEVLETLLDELGHDTSFGRLARYVQEKRPGPLGTVGCVARDATGLIAAGTSTGGRRACYPWRVGDTPLVGCGNYADEFAGVSCTGIGEDITRTTLARVVAFLVQQGVGLKEACDHAMAKIDAMGSQAGLIAIDRDGRIHAMFNTAAMPHAWARE